MADAAFDAVIVGGGTKGLAAAIYLAKYGGMTVGIFERRHELGGGLSSCEASAPGFIGDSHATEMSLYYYLPVQEDFPDFVEKGGRLAQFDAPVGVITREDQDGCVLYNARIDPKQERTAADIARYAGEQDAGTYKKIWDYACRPESNYFQARNETMFNLPPPLGQPTPVDRWLAGFLKQPDCPVDLEWFIQPPVYGAYQLFDSPGLALMFLRKAMQGGIPPVEPAGCAHLIGYMLSAPETCFAVGGTHSVAHAYARILLENGAKFFTHCHVDGLIIENGAARGIRLSDGTEIAARQLVLSTLSPHQLCFDLVGRENFSQRVIKKVEGLTDYLDTITWYTWALHSLPQYRAAGHNPDLDHVQSLAIGSGDRDVWIREAALRWLGENPPVASTLSIRSYSPVDSTRAPEGKHAVLSEQFVAPANRLSEKDWLEFKKTHAEDVMREWQQFAPNMTWENVIDYDPITPYDTAGRLLNMAPSGGYFCGLTKEGWRPLNMRPIAEFSGYRITPIKNLYGAGAAWQGGGSCNSGYVAYKAIAEDFGLRKPWEEKGRAW